jgi:hypothetical protein
VQVALQTGAPRAIGNLRLAAEQGYGGGTDLAEGQTLAGVILGAVLTVAMIWLCHLCMVMAVGLGGGIPMTDRNLRRQTACHHQHQDGEQAGQ